MNMKYWTTKEGKKIPFSKLSQTHKRNIERMIARNKLLDTGEHDSAGGRD